jgi:hypothetical protein
MTERRRVHLLVPDESGTSLATDSTGAVPVVELEFDSGPTAPRLDGWLLDHGAEATVVDYLIDQTSIDDDGTAYVVAELQLDVLPDGWRWTPLDDVRCDVIPALQPYVSSRVLEWRGAPTPTKRSQWAQRDWARALHVWVDQQLAVPAPTSTRLSPFRLWGISAVWRVDGAAATHWCKAVYPGFAAEPAITRELDRRCPGSVPRVIAIDDDRRVLLMADVAGSTVADRIERTNDAIRTLVSLQRELTPHGDSLLAAGAARRPLSRLADDVAAALVALVAPEVRDTLDIGADVVGGADVDALVRAIGAAVAIIDMLGMSETLVHGDFHPGNVMVDGDQVVIIDWSDAAWTHPLVEVGAWASWYRDEPDVVDGLWRTWGDAWGLRPARLDAARPALATVVAAYHLVSYVRIALALEPLRQAEATPWVRSFLADLVASAVG